MQQRRWRWVALALLAAGALAGCSDSGPPRYRLSGTAVIDGQPIPYGEVIITPDGAKKNSGPQGIARIQDGKFDTGAADGKGMAGGPTVLRVNGMSGPGGKTLCEYELKVELPREDTTYDVNVPKPSPKSGASRVAKEI